MFLPQLDAGLATVCAACYEQISHWIKFEEKATKSQNKTSNAETVNIQTTGALNEEEIPSEIDFVKKHNLKSLTINVTRLSQNVLGKFKVNTSFISYIYSYIIQIRNDLYIRII
jgi:hypothetical protein